MESPMFAALDEAASRQVVAACRRRRFRRGEVVFHEHDLADTLHVITRGRFGVRRATRGGDEVILNILGKGDAFGELALIDPEHRRSATIFALEQGETLSLHRADVHGLRRQYPAIDDFLLTVCAAAIRRLSDQVVEALHVSAHDRVARRVAALANLYDTGERPVRVPLTQQVLASLAGTTRPTANQALRALEEAGSVTLGRGVILVHVPEALEQQVL